VNGLSSMYWGFHCHPNIRADVPLVNADSSGFEFKTLESDHGYSTLSGLKGISHLV
jgi:hypothetical protein